MEAYLIYIGQASLPGVPARNLTRAEAEQHGEQRLLDSGLYRKAEPAYRSSYKQSRGGSQNKSSSGGSENKEE